MPDSMVQLIRYWRNVTYKCCRKWDAVLTVWR